MIRGAIFDLDGTLLDSMSLWDTIGEDYLRSLGKEPRENLAETFRTYTMEQAAQYYRDHYGVTLSVAEIVRGVNARIAAYYGQEVPAKPGTKEFLSRLRACGVQMCVATVTERALAEAALARLQLADCFLAVFTCGEVGCGKERPDIYRAALRHLGTKRGETIVFEDTLHALQTAAADGFLTAAVYDAHEKRQAELAAVADCYIRDYRTEQEFWRKFL